MQHLVSEERHKDNDPLNCLFDGFWTGFCNRSEWDFLALTVAVSSSTEAAMEEAVFSPFRSGMWYCLFCLSGSGLGGGLASWGWMCHIVTHLVPRGPEHGLCLSGVGVMLTEHSNGISVGKQSSRD